MTARDLAASLVRFALIGIVFVIVGGFIDRYLGVNALAR